MIRQILGYPAVFLATTPADAPALYHLMSALDLDDGVQYPMGGFGALVATFGDLAVQQGARVITGADVVRIDTGVAAARRNWPREQGGHGRDLA